MAWVLMGALGGATGLAGACSDDSEEPQKTPDAGDGDVSAPGDGDMGDGDNAGDGDGDSSGDGDGSSTVSADGFWPMMGYDARNNYHNPDETILSVDNADQLEVKWIFEVDGYPAGTPIVADGKVFVLASGGVYGIDLTNGQELWSNSDIVGTASAAYHDGAIYVHTTPGANLYKLSATDGAILWGPVKTYDWEMSDGTSSPIVAGDHVYVGHCTSLEVQGSKEAQLEARGGVVAINIADGSEAWHYWTTELPENGAMVWSTVSVDDDTVYASTGNNYTVSGANSDAIHAISVVDGSRQYASQVREGDVWVLNDPMLVGNPDVDFGANPILMELDGKELVAAGDKASAFWVLDRATGEVQWSRENLSGGTSPSTGGVLNNGAFDGNAFYVMANQPPAQSVLVAMNPEDGSDVWAPKTYEKITWGMPTTANGLLVVPVGDELRILNAATGDELKMFNTGGTIGAGAPVIAGGKIIVASGLQYPLNRSVQLNNEIICYGLPGDSGGGDGDSGDGDGDGDSTMALEPTFSNVWQEVIVGTGCNGGALCHGGPTGNLELIDKDAGYAALVGVDAMGLNLTGDGPDCADTDVVRVVAGDPDASLLVQKLEGTQACGTEMPPGGTLKPEQIKLVRDWVAAGAKND